jgi:hypothetical protein
MALMLAHYFKIFRRKPGYFMAFSVIMFLLYHPVSVQDRFARTQTLPREYRFTMEFLGRVSKIDKRFLIIADRPGQYTVCDFGAVNFDFANRTDSLCYDITNHLYGDIYVMQDIFYSTGKPSPSTELDGRYGLKTLAESQNTIDYFTRISKVVSIKKGKQPEAPQQLTNQAKVVK